MDNQCPNCGNLDSVSIIIITFILALAFFASAYISYQDNLQHQYCKVIQQLVHSKQDSLIVKMGNAENCFNIK